VNTLEVDAVRDDVTVVSASEYRIGSLVDRDTPDPVRDLSNFTKFDTLLVPESDLLVRARHHEVLSSRIE